ncbi:MAG: hypothetical protein U1F68_02930 [Gammaproteobacteria bacterium]
MADDFDSPWQDILEHYFAEFMAFFFPDAHADIDWSKNYESLDTELQQIVREAELGKRLADKLMKVYRRSGQEQIVYVHVEVQGEYERAFPERMYVCHYRLYDRYRNPIVSLAVLGDGKSTWRPNRFMHELWGCRIELRFPVVKLTDYNRRWDLLEASSNPFAVVVMAHLKTRATRNKPHERLQWKLRLVRALYERGFQREDVINLFRFIDWLLVLSAELKQQFHDELATYEATMSRPYITSIEQIGIEKGIQQGIEQGIEQGIQQGQQYTLRRLLARRFGPLPLDIEQRLAAASQAELKVWIERVLDAPSLEAVLASEH